MASVSQLPPRLNGVKEGTFVFFTIRDRWPKILSKAIDQVHRTRHDFIKLHGQEVDVDVKAIIHEFSELRYKIMTDKPLEDIQKDSIGDEEYWNGKINGFREALGEEQASYFHVDWLFAECYMYRRIIGAFLRSKLKTFDVFGEQKRDSLSHHKDQALQIVHHLWTCSNDVALEPTHVRETTACLIKISLWGNRVDLSLSGGDHEPMAASPIFTANSCDSFILADETQTSIDRLIGLRDARVDIVLDNAGIELVADLALAEWLMKLHVADKIVFHGKAVPWFVSDVTREDLDWVLDYLLGVDVTARTLAHKWKLRFSTGEYEFKAHTFWTQGSPYANMRDEAPDLHAELNKSSFIFFKGDLNYRKLVGDREWPLETPFSESLEGLGLPRILALRTLKSETVSGLDESAIEKVEESFGDSLGWMTTGEYAVIQFHEEDED